MRRRFAVVVAVFVVLGAIASPATGAVFPTLYPMGSAHLDVTETATGQKHSYDLPVYPPPSGAREDLLQVGEVRDPFGFRPAQTEWFDNIGRMQFWFAGLSNATATPAGAAPFLGVTGPLKLGTSESGQSTDMKVAIRLPGQPYGGENQTAAGGHCTVTIDGNPATELTGTVSCKKVTSIFMNGQIPQPPDIDLEATFAVQTGPAPPESSDIDAAIDHIELVQVVQDAKNSVPLIADKRTVARVFLRVNEPKPKSAVLVTVELFGLRDGSAAQPRLEKLNRVLTIRPAPDRASVEESVAFALPPAWTAAGSLGLQATVTLRAPWHETKPDDNDYVDTVIFGPGNSLQIAYVAVCLRFDSATNKKTDCPNASFATDWSSRYAASRVEALFPIREGGVQIYALPGEPWLSPTGLKTLNDGWPLLNWLEGNLELARRWTADTGHSPDQLIGVAPGEVVNKTGYGGASNGKHAAFLQEGSALGFGIAHEVGHNMGFGHQKDDDSRCHNAPPPFDPGPTSIGELGFDPLDIFRYPAAMTLVPAAARDFMSYCAFDEWINVAHYQRLMEALPRATAGSPALASVAAVGIGPGAAAAAATPSGARELIVVGSVRQDGSGGTLLPAFSAPADPATYAGGATSGPICLRTRSKSGAEAERCFDVPFTSPETGAATDVGAFAQVIPDPGDLVKLTLAFRGRELASLAADGLPTVSTEARAGEAWSSPQTLRWTTAGAPAATSRTTVLYSPDGGRLWLPFAPDLTGTELTVDPATLVAGAGGMFRVLVTDGLHTASADIGPIAVPDSVGRPPLPTTNQFPPGPGTNPTTPPAAPSAASGGTRPSTPAAPRDSLLITFLVVALAVLIGGGVLAFALTRGRSRRAAPSGAGLGLPASSLQPPPAAAPEGQQQPIASAGGPPAPWPQGQPPPAAPGDAPSAGWSATVPDGVPSTTSWQQPPAAPWGGASSAAAGAPPARDLTRPAAVLLAILGAVAVLLFAFIVVAAALASRHAGGPEPGEVAGIAVVGAALGILALIGAALAWRGNAAGRVIGIAFCAIAALFGGAAVVAPIPNLPPALSVLVGLLVVVSSLFVIGAFTVTARPRR